jgi:diguanylate cyclase (GGDEF)-like protein
MLLVNDGIHKEILNALPEHICIINLLGNIVFVNEAWVDYERANTNKELTEWLGINYLDSCDESARGGSEMGKDVAEGIRAVINQEKLSFQVEYPCHSPAVQMWCLLNCASFEFAKKRYLLLQHLNITQKIKADINSNVDALTGVGNRRAFNEFLEREWRRCARMGQVITAIIIDIDDFKRFNDTYGHVKGDQCLRLVSQTLKHLVHRPSDIFCRFGGEEFVYILGNTNIHTALQLCERIHRSINAANKAKIKMVFTSIRHFNH